MRDVGALGSSILQLGVQGPVQTGPLAGQVEVYLVGALNAYKSGDRKNEMMSAVAPSLSKADIEDLAAYFSGIKVTVEPSK